MRTLFSAAFDVLAAAADRPRTAHGFRVTAGRISAAFGNLLAQTEVYARLLDGGLSNRLLPRVARVELARGHLQHLDGVAQDFKADLSACLAALSESAPTVWEMSRAWEQGSEATRHLDAVLRINGERKEPPEGNPAA